MIESMTWIFFESKCQIKLDDKTVITDLQFCALELDTKNSVKSESRSYFIIAISIITSLFILLVFSLINCIFTFSLTKGSCTTVIDPKLYHI